tara:strand:+ start:111 stop:569 length:459 start_codon:yes stop_codon:yes gene_type:complete
MAHFAELNSSNEVLQVVVISNEDVNANGGDESSQAETFVASLVPYTTGGVAWKQTSYNNNFRKQYAGIGMTYDATKNKFISIKPYPSWSLDSNDDWKAPVTYPSVTEINSVDVLTSWDEDNQKWLGKTFTGDDYATVTSYQWDATNKQWNEV